MTCLEPNIFVENIQQHQLQKNANKIHGKQQFYVILCCNIIETTFKFTCVLHGNMLRNMKPVIIDDKEHVGIKLCILPVAVNVEKVLQCFHPNYFL